MNKSKDIIIEAQSLKNDGTADTWLQGRYLSPEDRIFRDLRKFRENLNKTFGVSGKYEEDEKTGIKSATPSWSESTILLKIPGEKRDNVGRVSPICIQLPFDDINNILPTLDEFSKKSGRTITTEERQAIPSILEKIEKARTLLARKAVGAGVIAVVGGFCLHKIFKSAGNKK
jgi:hypothetical protein